MSYREDFVTKKNKLIPWDAREADSDKLMVDQM